jgi:hypothetical protein
MAISAYELFDCIDAMTPAQRRELYGKLHGAIETRVAGPEMQKLYRLEKVVDLLKGAEFMEEHHWHELLDMIRTAIAMGTPRQQRVLGDELYALMPPPLRCDPSVASPSGVPVTIPISKHQTAETGIPAWDDEKLAQYTKACLSGLRDRVRGLRAEQAAPLIHEYLVRSHSLKFDHTVEVLRRICDDPIVKECVAGDEDSRSIFARVMDLDREARTTGGMVVFECESGFAILPADPESRRRILNGKFDDDVPPVAPGRLPEMPECTPWMSIRETQPGKTGLLASSFLLMARLETRSPAGGTGCDVVELNVDFDTDLSSLREREGQRSFQLILYNVVAPEAVFADFLKRFADVRNAAQNNLFMDRYDLPVVLTCYNCVLSNVGISVTSEGVTCVDWMQFIGTQVRRESCFKIDNAKGPGTPVQQSGVASVPSVDRPHEMKDPGPTCFSGVWSGLVITSHKHNPDGSESLRIEHRGGNPFEKDRAK